MPIEWVQDESSGRSTPVEQPFVAKYCMTVMFWVFNHREIHLTEHRANVLLHDSLHLVVITTLRDLRGFVDPKS